MKTIQGLWDDFNSKYANYPVPFTDDIIGDGITGIWTMSFFPVYDLSTLPISVYTNTGTFATPVWTLKVEGTDFVVNYETGVVTFLTGVPPLVLDTAGNKTVSCTITANHCKLNLKQFIKFYNLSIAQMSIFWPRYAYDRYGLVELGLSDNSQLLSIDTALAPYNTYKEILEIFQNAEDIKHVPFYKRNTILYFSIDDNSPRYGYTIGPSDYNPGPFLKTKSLYTPFWIKGKKNYPFFDVSVIDPNMYLLSETFLSVEDGSVENMLMRIALHLYNSRLHWSERMNASTLRMSSIKDIQGIIMGLNMDLMKHTGDNAPGKGSTPSIELLQ